MGNWIAFITLGCFCVLASYSVGYDDMRQKTLARMMDRSAKPVVAKKIAKPVLLKRGEKLVYIPPHERPLIIADIFSITKYNIATAHNILGQ